MIEYGGLCHGSINKLLWDFCWVKILDRYDFYTWESAGFESVFQIFVGASVESPGSLCCFVNQNFKIISFQTESAESYFSSQKLSERYYFVDQNKTWRIFLKIFNFLILEGTKRKNLGDLQIFFFQEPNVLGNDEKFVFIFFPQLSLVTRIGA